MNVSCRFNLRPLSTGYDITICKTKISNIQIAQYLKTKGIQNMKFGQLIESIMRKSFLENSFKKSGRETIPDPFLKQSKFSISLGR